MKHYYFLLLLITSVHGKAQNINCDEANSYLVNAYSHVKDAYDSNNISHLKYYANRSLESFKLSKKNLKDCNCETALNLANKSIDLLVKVEDVETFEDGRFFVKRARDLSKESVIEIDKCSYANDSAEINTSEATELSALEKEQLALKQQQQALKIKAAQIKNKLAQQEEKALLLKKEQLVVSYQKVLTSNIKTYNKTLSICNCNHKTLVVKDASIENIKKESIESIKKHYLNYLKVLGSNPLCILNNANF